MELQRNPYIESVRLLGSLFVMHEFILLSTATSQVEHNSEIVVSDHFQFGLPNFGSSKGRPLIDPLVIVGQRCSSRLSG